MMRGLNALAWRGLRARPLRSTLSAIGVALGVAVLFAGLATSAGIDASIERTVTTLVGDADLRVAAFGETGLSSGTVAEVGSTPGVAVTAPAFERRTYLGADPFGAGDTLPAPVTILGIDPAAEPRLHDLTLALGTPLRQPDATEALVSATLAREDGLAVGDDLTVQGPGEPLTYTIVGILAADGPATGGSGRAMLVPLATAQLVFDDPGVTRIDIGLADGTDPAAVTAALQAEPADRAVRPLVPARPGRVDACVDRGFRGDDRAHRRGVAVRGRVPDLQHAVDDRRRASPRAGSPPGGRRDPRPADLVHPRAGIGDRCRRRAAGDRRGRRARDRDGLVGRQHRRGAARGTGHHAGPRRGGPRHRSCRDPRGRPRAGAPCRSHPARRSPQGTPRPADRAPRASALARGGLRRGRGHRPLPVAGRCRRGRPHPLARRVRRPARRSARGPVRAAGARPCRWRALRTPRTPGGASRPGVDPARSRPGRPDRRRAHHRARDDRGARRSGTTRTSRGRSLDRRRRPGRPDRHVDPPGGTRRGRRGGARRPRGRRDRQPDRLIRSRGRRRADGCRRDAGCGSRRRWAVAVHGR